MLLFLLTTVARTSKTMLNISDENDHPCFVPDLRGNAFSFSLLRMMLVVGLSYMALIMLIYVLSMLTLWRALFFYHKQALNFVKSFFCIYWNDHMAFILQFVDVMYHTDWFVDTEGSLHPWDKSQLIMGHSLCNALLNLFF